MKELGLKSIVRRKKPGYRKGSAHKVFPDLLNQKFSAEGPNGFLCVDFTYLYLKGGKVAKIAQSLIYMTVQLLQR